MTLRFVRGLFDYAEYAFRSTVERLRIGVAAVYPLALTAPAAKYRRRQSDIVSFTAQDLRTRGAQATRAISHADDQVDIRGYAASANPLKSAGSPRYPARHPRAGL